MRKDSVKRLIISEISESASMIFNVIGTIEAEALPIDHVCSCRVSDISDHIRHYQICSDIIRHIQTSCISLYIHVYLMCHVLCISSHISHITSEKIPKDTHDTQKIPKTSHITRPHMLHCIAPLFCLFCLFCFEPRKSKEPGSLYRCQQAEQQTTDYLSSLCMSFPSFPFRDYWERM